MRHDLTALFMPDGNIPMPAVVPPGARTPGNLFEMRSHKMGRDLLLESELEWLYAKKLDSDPRVLWFCEHYPQKRVWVETRWKTTVFDMLICFQNYEFLLVENKYRADSNPMPGTDAWWQLRAQKIWTGENNVPYEIVDELKVCKNSLELKNIRKILGLLAHTPPESVCRAVLAVLPFDRPFTINQLTQNLSAYHNDDVIRAVCSLIFEGIIDAPLDTKIFNRAMPLTRC